MVATRHGGNALAAQTRGCKWSLRTCRNVRVAAIVLFRGFSFDHMVPVYSALGERTRDRKVHVSNGWQSCFLGDAPRDLLGSGARLASEFSRAGPRARQPEPVPPERLGRLAPGLTSHVSVSSQSVLSSPQGHFRQELAVFFEGFYSQPPAVCVSERTGLPVVLAVVSA